MFLEWLREKHTVKMAPLNQLYIDDAIQDLPKICHTMDAYTTYKNAGWKAFFSKYKNQSVSERHKADQKMRDKIAKGLPKNLRDMIG